MRTSVKICTALALVVCLLISANVRAADPAGTATALTPTSAATTMPTAVVKGFYAKLQESMQQGEQLGYTGRYKKLDPVIQSSFNLPVMTRLAVGTAWTKANSGEQQSLVTAFSEFTVASYAHQFSDYNGEEFAVIDEKPIAGGVIVETTLTPKDKAPVALNYLLRPDVNGSYRIVDVFLDGSISQLAARRAEFNAITERGGIQALVNSIDEKSKQMGPT